jgi:squalene-hopene/tetraprenyl-beta-curcumene cyclase
MVEVRGRKEIDEGLAGLEAAIKLSREFLLGAQYPDGYWWGELESNPTIEAEYILLTYFLGVGDEERWRKVANHILSRQRGDGTWGQFYGAPGDLSTSAECYLALKLAGISPDEPLMLKAREFILSRGGIPKTRIFTKIWLALLGQWEWKGVPVMPPEIMLLPNWFPVTIYDFSSWARSTVVPLLILLDARPVKQVPEWAFINELYPLPRDETDYSIVRPKRLMGWETFFYAGDIVLRKLEKLPWKPTRGQAIKRAEDWILERQEADGSWGGIQPPWVYSLMALHTLGYPTDHPVIAKGLAGLDGFAIEERDTLRIQACISPLWDTCLAMIALLDSGMEADDPRLVKAGNWFLKEQALTGGDWQVKAKSVQPGGWAFEFHNDVYPDVDDTAEIVMALQGVYLTSKEDQQKSINRAVHWVLGMQCHNGGWAAFDKDNTNLLMAKLPFSDFGEAIDPPSVDVTAHVLEMMGKLGHTPEHPAVARGLEYILSEQEDDGAWFGRWGVNYIYGVGAVLPAFKALGMDMSADYVRRAVQWMVEHQNSDGGWGESCASYVDPAFRGKGPSTASQTAWALLGLLAAGEVTNTATKRGVLYLIESQQGDGSWNEPYFTGTGFPGYGVGQRLGRYLEPDDPGFQGTELQAGFMINYHMYRNYWPLTALGRYKRLLKKGERGPSSSGVAGMQDAFYVQPRISRRKQLKKLIPMW